MENKTLETTLWSECPIDIVSQGETDLGLQLLTRPLSEGPILKSELHLTLFPSPCQPIAKLLIAPIAVPGKTKVH